MFVAKIALPHEQSLAGGVFNTVMQVCRGSHFLDCAVLTCWCFLQIGSAVGLAITTVVADRVTRTEAAKRGIDFDPRAPLGASALPADALLRGYRAAQWTSFGCTMLGEEECDVPFFPLL